MTIELNNLTTKIPQMEILKYNEIFAQIDDIILLTLGAPDFNVPKNVKQATIDAINNNQTGYGPGVGTLSLRQEVVNYLKRKYGLDYQIDQITVTNGLSEAIGSLLMATLNPGDGVIIPSPFFSPYESSTILAHGEPILVDTKADGFKLTPNKLQTVIAEYPHAKALLMCFPSNPTGVTYSEDELKALAKIIEEHQLLVYSDEIYSELTYEGQHVSMAKFLPDLTFLMNGVSKSHAMTGYRVGFVANNTKYSDAFHKAHEMTTPVSCPFNQIAAEVALRDGDESIEKMRSAYEKRRNYLVKELTDLDFKVASPDGAFYLFPEIPEQLKMDDRDFTMKLAQEAGVAVIPGSAFGPGGENCIRISYAASMDDLQVAIQRIKQFVLNHS